MQRISFAPVLSATLSRDSCWIIGLFSWLSRRFSPGCPHQWPVSLAERMLAGPALLPGAAWCCRPGLLGLLEDLDDPPALGGRQRAGLLDPHAVADAALVDVVVGLELAGAAEHLAVEGVLDAVLDGHDHRLVHLVADHEAFTNLAVRPALVTLRVDVRPGLLLGLSLVLFLGLFLGHVASLAHFSLPASTTSPGVCRIPSSRS